MKKTYFEWREVKTVEEVDDNSKISKFYDDEANRLKYFDPAVATADLETNGSWFPKLSTIPSEVAIKVATKPTTAWELFRRLCNYDEDKDAVVKAVLKKKWALAASRWMLTTDHLGQTNTK